ncbi:MAG TPA: dienelactone hydrolase family protein [Nitrososphaera sp.]|nr:dienelactone hydrolase family protein [Nitrososphaera sp.]
MVLATAIALAVWTIGGIQKGESTMSNVAMLGAGNNNVTSSSLSKVETSMVKYYDNTSGFLAKPAADDDGAGAGGGDSSNSSSSHAKYPGIVMVHEWWGLNDNIKEMARQMASHGYVVLAVDLFRGQVTADSSQAQALATGVRNNPGEAIKNLQAAVGYLRNSGFIDGNKVGSLGWCFGGDWSLQLALNEKMNATALYYGQPVTDPKALSVIKWPVLGVFGSADQSIPVNHVNAFKQALDKDHIENEIYVYNGVGHAFANPSGPNYAPSETKDAWQKTLAFFDAHLK